MEDRLTVNENADEAEIDWKLLEVFSDGSAAGNVQLHYILNLFIETSRTTLVEIRTGMDTGDDIFLAKALHRLRGSCLTVGAMSMTQSVLLMETQLRERKMVELTGLRDELEKAFDRTCVLFERLIDGRITPHQSA